MSNERSYRSAAKGTIGSGPGGIDFDASYDRPKADPTLEDTIRAALKTARTYETDRFASRTRAIPADTVEAEIRRSVRLCTGD
jgi:hypothetical protein